MKNNFIKIFIIISTLMLPTIVFAHPGRTDSSGCHTCKTNCSSWGLEDYEYHCHSGNTYTNSKGDIYDKAGTKISSGKTANEDTTSKEETSNNTPQKEESTNNSQQTASPSVGTESNNNTTSDSKPTVSKPVKKSEDTSLKYIKIDNQEITISDEIIYETNKKNIELNIEPTDNKSKVEFNNKELILGKNEIIIKVTAEAGNIKEYKLIITRKEIQEENNIQIQNSNNDNETESAEEDSSGISSLLTLGGIGAAVYYIKKKK